MSIVLVIVGMFMRDGEGEEEEGGERDTHTKKQRGESREERGEVRWGIKSRTLLHSQASDVH
jgi:hypothetical protein